MKIIIEGPDQAGKTTWAKKFVNRYDLEYNHLTAQDPRGALQYVDKFLKEDQVWDRHFISEYVYSKIFNRETEINTKMFEAMIKHARIHDVFILVVLAKHYNVSEESIAIQDKQQEIHDEFYRVAELYELPILWRDDKL